MQNHADFARKLVMRSEVIGSMRPRFVADCFAGTGDLTAALWAGIADRVLCIEHNPDCAPALEVLARRHKNMAVEIARNEAFISRIVAADVVDCDAYGMVMPFIHSLVKAGLHPGTLVFFTDGTPMKARRVKNAERAFRDAVSGLFATHHVEMSRGGLAYYGHGRTR